MIILDGVKDHIVWHIIEKDTSKKMWDVIVNMYYNPIENRKLFLREKLRSIRMYKSEDMVSTSLMFDLLKMN